MSLIQNKLNNKNNRIINKIKIIKVKYKNLRTRIPSSHSFALEKFCTFEINIIKIHLPLLKNLYGNITLLVTKTLYVFQIMFFNLQKLNNLKIMKRTKKLLISLSQFLIIKCGFFSV